MTLKNAELHVGNRSGQLYATIFLVMMVLGVGKAFAIPVDDLPDPPVMKSRYYIHADSIRSLQKTSCLLLQFFHESNGQIGFKAWEFRGRHNKPRKKERVFALQAVGDEIKVKDDQNFSVQIIRLKDFKTIYKTLKEKNEQGGLRYNYISFKPEIIQSRYSFDIKFAITASEDDPAENEGLNERTIIGGYINPYPPGTGEF